MWFNYVLLFTLYVNEEDGLLFFLSYMQQRYYRGISHQMGEVWEWETGDM